MFALASGWGPHLLWPRLLGKGSPPAVQLCRQLTAQEWLLWRGRPLAWDPLVWGSFCKKSLEDSFTGLQAQLPPLGPSGNGLGSPGRPGQLPLSSSEDPGRLSMVRSASAQVHWLCGPTQLCPTASIGNLEKVSLGQQTGLIPSQLSG